MITVVNKRTWKGAGVYIGRPSPLGNPFPMAREDDRAAVIEQYRTWLDGKIRLGRGPVYGALRELARRHAAGDDLALVCWCAPKACHGDVIKAAVEAMAAGK